MKTAKTGHTCVDCGKPMPASWGVHILATDRGNPTFVCLRCATASKYQGLSRCTIADDYGDPVASFFGGSPDAGWACPVCGISRSDASWTIKAGTPQDSASPNHTPSPETNAHVAAKDSEVGKTSLLQKLARMFGMGFRKTPAQASGSPQDAGRPSAVCRAGAGEDERSLEVLGTAPESQVYEEIDRLEPLRPEEESSGALDILCRQAGHAAAVAARMLGEGNRERRLKAAFVLSRLPPGDVLPHVGDLVGHGNPATRAWAAGMAALLRHTAATPMLERLLGDDNDRVRLAAAHSLLRIGYGGSALPHVSKIATNGAGYDFDYHDCDRAFGT